MDGVYKDDAGKIGILKFRPVNRLLWMFMAGRLVVFMILLRIDDVFRSKKFVEYTFNFQILDILLILFLAIALFIPEIRFNGKILESLKVILLVLVVLGDLLFLILFRYDMAADWWGSPLMMQFGLFYYIRPRFWLYYLPVQSAAFLVFVLADKNDSSSEDPLIPELGNYGMNDPGKSSEILLLGFFIVAGGPLFLVLSFYFGLYLGIFILLIESSAVLIGYLYRSFVAKRREVRSGANVSEVEKPMEFGEYGGKLHLSDLIFWRIPNMVVGILVAFLDGFFLFIIHGLGWVFLFFEEAPCDILSDMFVLLGIFPLALIFWYLIFRTFKNSYVITGIEAVISAVMMGLFIIDPYGQDVYRIPILWLSIFTIVGAWGLFYEMITAYPENVGYGVITGLLIRIYKRIRLMKGLKDFLDHERMYLKRLYSFTFGLIFVLSMGTGILLNTTPYEPAYSYVGLAVIAIYSVYMIPNIIKARRLYGGGESKDNSGISRASGNADGAGKGGNGSSGKNNPDIPGPVKRAEEIIKNGGGIKRTAAIVFLLVIIIGVPLLLPMGVRASQPYERVLGVANSGDYALWYADSLRTIDRYYRPNLDINDVHPDVYVELARGEHEGFQVVFTPLKVPNLNVWYFRPLGDLVLDSQAISYNISRNNIEISRIGYIKQVGYQFPDTLYPFGRFDTARSLKSPVNYPFYVDVSIPANDSIPAGDYSVEMEFYCFDYHREIPAISSHYWVRRVTFTLHVHVFDFTISPKRHIGAEIIWGIPDNDEWVNFYNEYRLDPYYPPNPVERYSTDPNNLTIEFNWTRWESQLSATLDAGMMYFPITWTPPGIDWENNSLSDEYKTLMRYYLLNVTTFLKNHTTPWGESYFDHAYFFIRDEPDESIYDTIILVAKYLHSIVPDLRIMETMNHDLNTYSDEFLEEVDIYCQHINRWVPAVRYPSSENISVNGWPERISEFLQTHNPSRRKEMWVYLTGNGFPVSDTQLYYPGIAQRNSFWMYWVYGIKGWLYWSFNWGVDQYEGYGYAVYGESRLVNWGEKDEPLSSLRLERVRDGIEDYEYLWLLNQTCAKLKTDGFDELADQGYALLDKVNMLFNDPSIYNRYPIHDKTDLPHLYSYKLYKESYLTLRHEIGEFLDLYA